MMSLLKKIIKEENEAIKFDYTWSGAEKADTPAVDVRVSGEEISLQLTKLPRSLSIRRRGVDEQEEMAFNLKGQLRTRLSALKTSNPAAFDKLSDLYAEMFYDRVARKQMSNELSEELGEIFDHLNTLLKSKLILFAHELEKREEQEFKNSIAEFNKKLDELE